MKQKTYKCANRHCQAAVSKPGRCTVCAKIWAETIKKAKKAKKAHPKTLTWSEKLFSILFK